MGLDRTNNKNNNRNNKQNNRQKNNKVKPDNSNATNTIKIPRNLSPSQKREFIERRRRELKAKKAKLMAEALLELLAPVVGIGLVVLIIVSIVKGIAGKIQSREDANGDSKAEITISTETGYDVSDNYVLPTPEPVVEKSTIGIHDAAKYGLFEGYTVSKSGASDLVSEEVLSEYAVIIDAKTGKVIANRKGDAVIYPASMTKVMTLLVAVEHLENEESLNDIVTISSNDTNYAYSHDLSIVGYAIGEETTVKDLLYGTILPSGGDAAHALAVYTAGSEEAFADLMNEKCRELGISSTCHFTNCSGIYNDEHYCTLIDMAIIMKAAEENELCRQVLGERIYKTTSTPEHPDGIEISNWFIRRIEDKDVHGKVLGAKTGFVNESGCNAVSYQESNDGGQYICVTVNAWSSWRAIYDHVAIYDIYTN